MEELTLTQQLTVISLNSLDSLHMTNAKKMALRCISAAVILELYLEDYFTNDKLSLNKDILSQPDITLYQEAVLKPLIKGKDSQEGTLKQWLMKASRLSERSFKNLEHTVTDSLKGYDLLTEIPNLLGCDLEFKTAGISMKEYKSKNSEYIRQTESIRSEWLEEGNITDEDIMLLWLLRECCCLSEIFSKNELEKIYIRINELYQTNSLVKRLYEVNIHHMAEVGIKGFLTAKRELIKTPVGTGLNFRIPMIERAQSVFIETEEWFSKPDKRLTDILKCLHEHGHEVEVFRTGEVPLLKIDNILYEAVPDAVSYRITVQGVRLRRYQM